MILYRIQPNPQRRSFSVTVTVQNPLSTGQRLRLPNWIPGSYMIRDFSKHVSSVKAACDGQPLKITKLDKSTWVCDPASSAITIHYEVNAWDLSVRGAHVDMTHAYFNGSSVFMQADGFEHTPCTVEIVAPVGEQYREWRVATSLPEATAARYGFGLYQAQSYDELIDHPVEIGNFTLIKFSACGVEHEMMLTGKHRADTDRLARDLTQLCETQLRFFGTPYPMTRYVFLVTVLGQGFGGLEHRSSTSLHCSRQDLPTLQDDPQKVSRDYNRFLALCCHEYFHTWWVKRAKPVGFIPYQLEQETYTQQLWIFEGFTRYYEDRMLILSGLITPADYLQNLEEEFTLLQGTPGRKCQSVVESSFDAWTKFYKQDENSPNAIVSYYTKGGVIALLLDGYIRHQTQQQYSVDQLIQAVWKDYGSRGIGLKEGQFDQLLQKYTGCDFTAFLQDYVYGIKELPIQEALSYLGIDCHFRAMASNTDKGGVNEKVKSKRAYLGVRGQKTAEGLQVSVVLRDSAAEMAGIAPQDCLVAFDGLKIQSDWENQLAGCEAGEKIQIVGFRRDELMHFEVVLQEVPKEACVLKIAEQSLFNQFIKNP